MNKQLTVGNKQRLETLKTYLAERKGRLQGKLPNNISTDALINQALKACLRSPKLLECSTQSIYTAMLDASELGLEPFTGQQYAFVLPYKNKMGGHEAKFMPSYRGMLELARRSGQLLSVESDIIYETDAFEIERGLNPKLKHIPNFLSKERGKEILVYAVVRFKDGGFQFDVMTVHDIEKIRSKSKSPNYGPWVDYWGEMAKKTVLKKVLKTCPMATEYALAKAIEKDNQVDYSDDDVIDIDTENLDAAETAPSKSEELAEKLGGEV